MIPDQVKMWNKKHSEGDHAKLRGVPSPLARLVEPYFPRKAYILELGCGVGRDAVYFADNGHSVVATDGSEVVIRQSQESIREPHVKFSVLDIRQRLPYEQAAFGVVYVNLALHYYGDVQTHGIVAEVERVLKPGGILAFACKSKDEVRTKDAQEVEKDVFVAPNGHTLHLFSTDYAKELIEDRFEILHLDEVDEVYIDRVSSIVRCIARKEGES